MNGRASVRLAVQAWVGREAPDGCSEEPSAAGWQPIGTRGGGGVKPTGGLWTSTWDAESGSSDWMRWCIREEFGGPTFDTWLLTPAPDTRVVQIDTLADLIALVDAYPNYRQREYPNWEAVARDYDAVNLTESGQWATRLPPPDGPDLYGWDCESTLWLRWSFTGKATHLGTVTPRLVHDEASA